MLLQTSRLNKKGEGMGTASFSTTGELKQALTREYNRINNQIFAVGVVTLKVDVFEDKIFMQALHKRVPALEYLSRENRIVSDLADLYLVKAFKREFKRVLSEQYGLAVKVIFKDYDDDLELSSTLIVLKANVQTYLN